MEPTRTALALAALVASTTALADAEADRAAVAALDTEYQAAVERNDWRTMDRILGDGFTLVVGDGRSFDRAALIKSAREPIAEFEVQREIPGTQTVRVWGDTAVITALLHLKGKRTANGEAFDYKLWFSDTYVRTADGWKYVFGQASLRLPQ
jgi:ketosteroid isomerase-like protein